MRKITILFFGVACFLATGLAFANQQRGMERMAKFLNLSEAQKEAIQKIHYSAAKKQIGLTARSQLLRLDLQQLLKQHKPDRVQVLALIDKMVQIHGAKKKLQILKRLDIKALLTPEQAKKAAQLHSRFGKGRKGRHGRRHHRRFNRGMHFKHQGGGHQQPPMNQQPPAKELPSTPPSNDTP